MVHLSRSPVHSDPEVMGGTLVFRDARGGESLLDYLDDGYTLDQFLELFPSVRAWASQHRFL